MTRTTLTAVLAMTRKTLTAILAMTRKILTAVLAMTRKTLTAVLAMTSRSGPNGGASQWQRNPHFPGIASPGLPATPPARRQQSGTGGAAATRTLQSRLHGPHLGPPGTRHCFSCHTLHETHLVTHQVPITVSLVTPAWTHQVPITVPLVTPTWTPPCHTPGTRHCFSCHSCMEPPGTHHCSSCHSNMDPTLSHTRYPALFFLSHLHGPHLGTHQVPSVVFLVTPTCPRLVTHQVPSVVFLVTPTCPRLVTHQVPVIVSLFTPTWTIPWHTPGTHHCCSRSCCDSDTYMDPTLWPISRVVFPGYRG